MTPRPITKLLLFVLIVIGIPYFWLLIDRGDLGSPYSDITAGALHKAAGSIPGRKPTSVIPFNIGIGSRTSNLLAAGSGLRPLKLVTPTFLIAGPSGTFVVDGRTFPGPVSDALAAPDTRLLFTTTRGVMAPMLRQNSVERLAQRAVLTRSQADYASAHYKAFEQGLRWRVTSRVVQPVAPGIVLIGANGRNPGSQLIYLETADGRRMVLAGSIAPIRSSWDKGPRPAARLESDWLSPHSRYRVSRWLATLGVLARAGVAVVPGNDAAFYSEWDCLPALRDPGTIPRRTCDLENPDAEE